MTAAKEYAKALFLLTEEEHNTEKAVEDVKAVKAAVGANPDYVKLLDTPALERGERVALADKAFAGVCESLMNLIKILAECHKAHLVLRVADEYLALYDESRGIERVEAITAVPLTQAQTVALESKVSALTGKKAVVKNTVDPKILGGMKLRYSGYQLDGSIKRRLDGFEEKLKTIIL